MHGSTVCQFQWPLTCIAKYIYIYISHRICMVLYVVCCLVVVLIRTSNFLHISLQINVWISQNSFSLAWTLGLMWYISHILQGCFTGIGAIIWLPQWQIGSEATLKNMGKSDHYLTITKHHPCAYFSMSQWQCIRLEGPEDPHGRNSRFLLSGDHAHPSIPLAQTPWGLTGRAGLQAGAQRVVWWSPTIKIASWLIPWLIPLMEWSNPEYDDPKIRDVLFFTNHFFFSN